MKIEYALKNSMIRALKRKLMAKLELTASLKLRSQEEKCNVSADIILKEPLLYTD